MPQDVVAAIGAVAREHGGLEEEQVEEWLLQLRAARRLQIECW
jgi:sulfite reductase alpha subunit-like flavoprotein